MLFNKIETYQYIYKFITFPFKIWHQKNFSTIWIQYSDKFNVNIDLNMSFEIFGTLWLFEDIFIGRKYVIISKKENSMFL